MKVYGIWNKEEEILQEYFQGEHNQYFGTKKEIERELGWLNCETDGNIYDFAVAELDINTGIITIKEITQSNNNFYF